MDVRFDNGGVYHQGYILEYSPVFSWGISNHDYDARYSPILPGAYSVI